MKKKLAVLTVNYKNYDVTYEFLDCFKTIDTDTYDIYIADLTEEPKELKQTSNAHLLKGENKGYAHGINLGLQQAIKDGHTHFMVINNDTRIEKNLIEKSLKSLESHPHTLLGGKIYYEKGYEYHDTYDKKDLGNVIWYAGGIMDWNNVYTSHRGVDEVDQGQYNLEEPTDFITGCFMLFDKSVVDTIGYWDEQYFLYYEDADYCMRGKLHTIPLIYDPSLLVWHKNSQSTGGSGSALHQKYQDKNRFMFGMKYAPWRTKLHLIKNKLFN